jgi:hypothetical protein
MKPRFRRELGAVSALQMEEGRMNGAALKTLEERRKWRRVVEEADWIIVDGGELKE